MIEINLIPAVKQELIKVQRVRATVISIAIIVGLASIAIVVLLAVYVFVAQTVRSTLAGDAIKSESAKLASVEDLSKTLTIQNQLKQLTALHDSKKIDSRIYDVLAAIVPQAPNDVQLSNLSVDSAAGVITVQGQAANSYAAVEIFKKTIESATVKYTTTDGEQETILASAVSTGDTSYGEDATGSKVLRFTLSFTYAPELFAPTSKNASIVISTQGNVTDSYLGVPKSIFVDRATDLKETN